jgi:WbqC-like protein family
LTSLSIDLQYFANLNWYKKAYNYKRVVFNIYEKHKKMSFRNRLWLSGADGQLSLSVPIVDGRNENQFYRDIKIVPGRWQVIHFRAISSCYNRSPWFEHYRDELAVLYNRPIEYLMDWNLACFEWINHQLEFPLEWELKSYLKDGDPEWSSEAADATNYFLPARKETWLKNGDIIKYTQVFQDRVGFVPGLSILDLLFCEGPGAMKKLV